MAAQNVLGVVATIIAAPPSPSNWLTAGYVDGRKKINLDFYVGLGTESAGSTIKMGPLLPAGAKVIRIAIHASASTSALTLSVGDSASATRYASAATGPATAGISVFSGMVDATNGAYLIGTNTNDNQILLTTGGATLGTGTIYGCEVEYTTD